MLNLFILRLMFNQLGSKTALVPNEVEAKSAGSLHRTAERLSGALQEARGSVPLRFGGAAWGGEWSTVASTSRWAPEFRRRAMRRLGRRAFRCMAWLALGGMASQGLVTLRPAVGRSPAAPRATAGEDVPQGLDARDVAFMERLRNAAREALTWPHLGEEQRRVWAAALTLDTVPVQDWWEGGLWASGPFSAAVRVQNQQLKLFSPNFGVEQELPPWFLERRNLTRRPPGQRVAPRRFV